MFELFEAASNYQAKLNQFLDGQSSDVQKFVKNALNGIFLGIKDDFDGYSEGKRPTIKDYGKYKVFKMMIQANSDVKKGDASDVKGKWNFHYPVKDYCSNLGKVADKKIDGDTYQCVFYNHNLDLDGTRSGSEYDNLTSQAQYPMVGCYSTGIGGSYKNLNKDVKGTTYSVIVSVPVKDAEEFKNPFMTKNGSVYTFSNDHHSSKDGKDSYTVEFDVADGEFVIREFTEGSADRFTIIYRGSRNPFKAFKALIDKFDGDTSVGEVERILTDHGLKVAHSWWFNPYTD